MKKPAQHLIAEVPRRQAKLSHIRFEAKSLLPSSLKMDRVDINLLRRGTMNRRGFLISTVALPGATMFPEVLAQSVQQITHVDARTDGALLRSNVVKAEGIQPESRARSKSLRPL
jgi:hypothetical protein